MRIERSTAKDDSASSVTVEIPVSSEADGYAVLTYVFAVIEGSSASSDQGLADALNDALSARTTDGCECVATANTSATDAQVSIFAVSAVLARMMLYRGVRQMLLFHVESESGLRNSDSLSVSKFQNSCSRIPSPDRCFVLPSYRRPQTQLLLFAT